MKECKICGAKMPDEAVVCEQCGIEWEEEQAEKEQMFAELPEEEIVETEAAEETEETEATAEEVPAPKKKASPAVIAAGVVIGIVVLFLGVLIFTIVNMKGESRDTNVKSVLTEIGGYLNPGKKAANDFAAVTNGEILALDGHHVNAYGLSSWSVHYVTDASGAVSGTYMDRNGNPIKVTGEEIERYMDTVVATCGDVELTNRELAFYYDQQKSTFMQDYSSVLSFIMDTTRGLDEQKTPDGTTTWQQNFLVVSVNIFQQMATLYQDALAAGYTLDENFVAAIDAVEAEMDKIAPQTGYATGLEYLRACFGPGFTYDAYKEYLKMNQLASIYAADLAAEKEVTAQEISDYYDANAENILREHAATKVDKNVMSVRHILVTAETTVNADGDTIVTDEAWAAAEAEAQKIYDEWKSGAATEESFAELANTYSEDPGSNTNGGLYTEVYPGMMVEAFNDWCFADGRQPGDTDIVQTNYGYHIMFYVEEGDYIFWQALAESAVRSEKATEERIAMTEKYEFSVDLRKAVIMDTVLPTTPAANAQ